MTENETPKSPLSHKSSRTRISEAPSRERLPGEKYPNWVRVRVQNGARCRMLEQGRGVTFGKVENMWNRRDFRDLDVSLIDTV